MPHGEGVIERGKRTTPVRRQTSAGGVLFKREGGRVWVVLIQPAGRNVWGLPKGLVEEGESPEAAAEREVREETGCIGQHRASLGTIEYWFYSQEEKTRIRKRVFFYLMEFEREDPRGHDAEVQAVQWIPVEEAPSRLTYDSEREILDRARRLISP